MLLPKTRLFWLLMLAILPSMSIFAGRFSPEAIRCCQLADSVNRTVTIIFAPDSMSKCSYDSIHLSTFSDSIKSVSLYGPMTDYAYRQPNYYLDQRSEDGCYYHTFSYDEVQMPGNSGQPEFTFIIDMKDDSTYYYIWPDTVGPGAIDKRLMFYNGTPCVMLLLPGGLPYLTTDRDELYARSLVAREIRPLEDFNLIDSVDQHHISNFRPVPGTNGLYRSYHPYFPSATQYDTEAARLYWVSELATQLGIQSDICLTSNMESWVGETYYCAGDSFIITMPPYYQQMLANNNVCYVGNQTGASLSVAQCYFHTDEERFARWFAEVINFIGDTLHPMPMQIHCAIGADRTGIFCALIEILCGQDWSTVVADYEATVNMKIQTYRHPNRLRYALIKMTGLDPALCTQTELAAAIRTHLVTTKQVTTNAAIDRMIQRLTQPQVTALQELHHQSQSTEVYDLLGRRVYHNQWGIRISGGKKWF